MFRKSRPVVTFLFFSFFLSSFGARKKCVSTHTQAFDLFGPPSLWRKGIPLIPGEHSLVLLRETFMPRARTSHNCFFFPPPATKARREINFRQFAAVLSQFRGVDRHPSGGGWKHMHVLFPNHNNNKDNKMMSVCRATHPSEVPQSPPPPPQEETARAP